MCDVILLIYRTFTNNTLSLNNTLDYTWTFFLNQDVIVYAKEISMFSNVFKKKSEKNGFYIGSQKPAKVFI